MRWDGTPRPVPVTQACRHASAACAAGAMTPGGLDNRGTRRFASVRAPPGRRCGPCARGLVWAHWHVCGALTTFGRDAARSAFGPPALLLFVCGRPSSRCVPRLDLLIGFSAAGVAGVAVVRALAAGSCGLWRRVSCSGRALHGGLPALRRGQPSWRCLFTVPPVVLVRPGGTLVFRSSVWFYPSAARRSVP